jgi:hypothetical protein
MFAVSTVVSTVKYLTEQQGERGIPDAARREAVVGELERYERLMAERTREHEERQRMRKDERV